MKFKESIFPVKEKALAQPGPAPSSDHQFLNEPNGDSDSEPGLVTLDQPLIGPTSPGPSAQRAQPPQPNPPPAPSGSMVSLPDEGTAPSPRYHLHPRDNSGHVIKTLETSADQPLWSILNLFQDVPNTF